MLAVTTNPRPWAVRCWTSAGKRAKKKERLLNVRCGLITDHPPSRGLRLRKTRRILGTAALAAGAVTLAWVVLVWRWQDPFTALYTYFQQTRLAAEYAQESRAFKFTPRFPSDHNYPTLRRIIGSEARSYDRSLRVGDPVGRLKIGRIGLNMIVVEGTDDSTLEKGPGHYTTSGLPGEGRLIYIAGHRTTFLAPFATINDIRDGDYMSFDVPYGTFKYRAIRHYIVSSDDVSILRNRGSELLRLQACHPRFFATHRYIVDARLVAFRPRSMNSWVTVPQPQPTQRYAQAEVRNRST